VGHAAENLFLQAESLGLATVVVGAFHDHEVTTVLHLPADHEPLLLMPIGRK
jgi:nitroreductase